MVILKYGIGQKVFIYEKGKLVEKVVNKIRAVVTEGKCEVGYQFAEKEGGAYWLLSQFDIYKDESEVFISMDDFIERSKAGV